MTGRTWRNASLIVLGSFLVYCAQDVANPESDDPGGPVADVVARDADGDSDDTTDDGSADGGAGEPGQVVVATCCPTPDRNAAEVVFDEVISEKDVNNFATTGPLDVSKFREVVLHASGCAFFEARYKFGVAGFVNGPEGGLSLANSTNSCDANKQLLAKIDTSLGNEVDLRFKVDPIFDGPDGIAVTIVGRR